MPEVTFPSSETAFICGPQLTIGSAENPFPYFDEVQVKMGVQHGTKFAATPPGPTEESDTYMNAQYYDLGLCLYNLYFRSNDPAHLALARKVTDSWWKFSPFNSGMNDPSTAIAPRNASMAGLMLRALDGRPELWDWIQRFVRYQFDVWLKRYFNEPALVNGVRDSSYMLLYAAQVARCLPDTFPRDGGAATNGAELRSGFLADAEKAAIDYFCRLQKPDGSWRWDDSFNLGMVGAMMPFHVGLLLHALIEVHQLTTDATKKATIRNSVIECVEHLFDGGPFMKRNAGIPNSPIRWRAFHYVYHGGNNADPKAYLDGDYVGTSANAGNVYDVQGARQSTATILHAAGWAYRETGDPKHAAIWDELYDSIFGFKEDQVSNYVAGYDPKGYNQHYRAAGSGLANRYGVSAPVDVPPSTKPRKVVWPDGEARRDVVLAAQRKEGYYLTKHLKGTYVEFTFIKLP